MDMKSYIRLLIKALIFVFCLVTVDYLGGFVFESLRKATFNRHPESLSFKTQYMVDKCTSDIIIIGSSTAAHAFIPSIIEDSTGMTAHNCAMDGHFFIYQNECINLLLDRYKPKIIVWDLNEHFLSTSRELEFQAINDLYPYYYRESTRLLIDSKNQKSKVRSFSKLYRYNSTLSTIVYEMISPSHFPDGYVPIETSGYVFPELKTDPNTITTFDNSKLNILHSTIERCKSLGVQLIFVITPKYANESCLLTDDFIALSDMLYSEQVEMLNYYCIFNSNASLFKDVAHLNDNGAKEFMQIFIPQLKNIKTY